MQVGNIDYCRDPFRGLEVIFTSFVQIKYSLNFYFDLLISFVSFVKPFALVVKREKPSLKHISDRSLQNTQFSLQSIAAVSCSSDAYRLGGVKMVLGLTGKLGREWVGAWVHGRCMA